MNLKIITHSRTIFDGTVDEIQVAGSDGNIGILPGRQPITTPLAIGVTKVGINGETRYYATMGGVFQFSDDNAVILTNACESESDIDIKRAEEAKARAEERLAKSEVQMDLSRAEMALARAMTRLKVVNHE